MNVSIMHDISRASVRSSGTALKRIMVLVAVVLLAVLVFPVPGDGIASGRPIVVSGDDNYPPFAFLDQDGAPAGFMLDLTRAVAQAMEMDLEIRLDPWPVVREQLIQGDIDVIQGMLYSPGRDATHDFSPPVAVIHYVAVVRKGEVDPPRDLADLAGMRLVVQRGDIMHDYVVDHGLEGQAAVVDSLRDVLRELARGRHEVALLPRLSAMYWIEKDGWNNLLVGRHSLFSAGFCYAVLKGRDDLLALFSEGLQVLRDNNEYRRIYEKWMGVYEEGPHSFLDFARYFGMVLLPLVVLLLVALLWSWALRRQVRLRTRQLAASEQKYRAFFENSLDAILLTTPQGGILAANPAACAMFGRTEEEIIQAGRRGLVDMSDPRLPELLEQRCAHGKALGELTFTRKDGSRFPAEVSSSAFRDCEGRDVTSMIIRDATERRQAERDLLQAKEQAEAANKAKSEFLANMSHEIRTPLNGIMGLMQLLQATTLDADQQKYVQMVFTSANRLTRLLSDILDLSMIEAGKLSIYEAEFSVRDLGNSVMELFTVQARDKGVDLKCTLDPALPPRVVGDEARIRQVLFNLMGNALKFTDRGEVRVDMTPLAPVRGEDVRILFTVSDTGIGIPDDKLGGLFRPFVQVDGSYTRKHQGAGLGLAIVKRIVDLLQGHAFVESVVGEGTTVYVVLPFKLSDDVVASPKRA